MVGLKPQIPTGFLWVVVPMSVQFSKPLQCCSDCSAYALPTRCSGTWVVVSPVLQVKICGVLLGSDSCMSSLWMSPEFLKQYYAVALPSFSLFQICLVLFYSYRQTSGFYLLNSEAQFPWLCQLPGPNNKRIEKGKKNNNKTPGVFGSLSQWLLCLEGKVFLPQSFQVPTGYHRVGLEGMEKWKNIKYFPHSL